MTRDEFLDMPEEELFARLLWGEARGEGLEGMVAVANVVMNRFNAYKKRYGALLHNIILAEWQFSCFNENDPNYETILNGPGEPISECRVIAKLAIEGLLKDITNGSTHYHTLSIMPYWAERPTLMIPRVTIGNHKFYHEV
uniref:Putative cell wall hydrolase n=1 Tax=viral metagenome TaxID=1070528 RepID=A0A6H1ZL01_9ZZZZ